MSERAEQAAGDIEQSLERLNHVTYTAPTETGEAQTVSEDSQAAWTGAAAGTMPRVGRNDPCPCGSGKKYKSCHGKLS